MSRADRLRSLVLGRADIDKWPETRPVPGVRAVRTGLRTAHLVAFGALYGGHLYGAAPNRLLPALIATVLTGLALAALEAYRTPAWPFQVRGIATFAKVLLVAAVAVWWQRRIALLTTVIVIGGVVSHMPSRFRYYSVLHGRAIASRESG